MSYNPQNIARNLTTEYGLRHLLDAAEYADRMAQSAVASGGEGQWMADAYMEAASILRAKNKARSVTEMSV